MAFRLSVNQAIATRFHLRVACTAQVKNACTPQLRVACATQQNMRQRYRKLTSLSRSNVMNMQYQPDRTQTRSVTIRRMPTTFAQMWSKKSLEIKKCSLTTESKNNVISPIKEITNKNINFPYGVTFSLKELFVTGIEIFGVLVGVGVMAGIYCMAFVFCLCIGLLTIHVISSVPGHLYSLIKPFI